MTTGVANAVGVVIDSAGQLGTVNSSREFKRDIRSLGDTTDVIMALRPVSFRYKQHDASAPLQYGLIAEEVAEVAPDLAATGLAGKVETVYYDKVNTLLLNEVQKQRRQLNELLRRLAELENCAAAAERGAIR